jgi:hypothetical protein
MLVDKAVKRTVESVLMYFILILPLKTRIRTRLYTTEFESIVIIFIFQN